MPRGNDPAAAQDFRDAYGVYGNAEELIRAHMAAQDPAVKKASLLPVDSEATAELDLDKLTNDVEGDGEVVAAAVRGNAIVCVVEDEGGRTYKTVLPADDSYAPPAADSNSAIREAAKLDVEHRDKLAALRAEQAQQLADERERLDEEFAAEAAKLREEQKKRLEKVKAEVADAEEAPKPTPKRATKTSKAK